MRTFSRIECSDWGVPTSSNFKAANELRPLPARLPADCKAKRVFAEIHRIAELCSVVLAYVLQELFRNRRVLGPSSADRKTMRLMTCFTC